MELIEAEVTDVAVGEGVFLCIICSMELSEAVCVDSEAREGDN